MTRVAISILVALMITGCISNTTGNPPLTGRSIKIAELPDVVRTAVRQAFPSSYITRASVIEVAPHPPSYLVRIMSIKNTTTSLLEISSTGHIGKEIPEQD